jgi:flagellar basal-body rod protein FlgG
MDTSLLISAGALQSFQKKVDSISNNVANANTPGFKRRETTFSEILASQLNQNQPDQVVGRLTPSGLRVGYGTRLGLTQLEMDQGQAIQTGNPFDLMITGSGFFKIGYAGTPDKNGTNNNIRYTRDGAFHLSPNPKLAGTYNLVHQNVGYLLDQKGDPIVLKDQSQVKIDANGNILINGQAGLGQKIAIVDINNPHLLQNVGENEFQISNTGNGANPADYEQPSNSVVSSGYLEGSNVDLTKEMTDLMVTQRGFQLNSRAVSYADQMMGIANSILK